jgi:adenylate cyclase
MFALKLLGGASIRADEGVLGGRSAQRRRIALLAMLALARSEPLSRDKIIALLWPEKDTEQARRLLSESLYVIRKSLGEDAVIAAGDDLRLNPEVVTSDLEAFHRALEKNNWEEAASVYGGPFLDGFFVSDAHEFERWVDSQRDRLAALYATTLERLANDRQREGNFRDAVEWWRKLAAMDPLNGRIAVQLMEALETSGDRAGALAHARVYANLLRQEFGAEPEPHVLAAERRIRESASPSPRATAPETHQPTFTETDRGNASQAPAKRRRLLTAAIGLAALAMLLVAAFSVAKRQRSAPDQASVAVLPFVNMTPGNEMDYFSEGMTEELLNALTKVKGLRVPARTSSFQFKGPAADIKDVGNKLGVGAVVEGSIRREGNKLRITAQLINVADGYHMWSEAYDRQLDDVFSVQEEIAGGIVGALLPRLQSRSGLPLVKQGTNDAEAHNLYLRGRYAWNKRTPDGFKEALKYFQDAIGRDSTYALAYTGVADSYLSLFDYDLMSAAEANPKARAAATRALALDPSLPEAHNSLAHLLLHEWDWKGSEAEFKRALELDPAQAGTYHWYALALTSVGKVDEAAAAMERAEQLDPLSPRISADLGMAYYAGRHYDKTLDQERKTLRLEPGYATSYWIMGMAYEQKGKFAEATKSLDSALKLQPGNPNYLAELARSYALTGRTADARKILGDLLHPANGGIVSPFFIALVYAALGDKDQAFGWLGRSVDERSGSVRYLKVEPRLDPLRSDPRFDALLKRVGLPN